MLDVRYIPLKNPTLEILILSNRTDVIFVEKLGFCEDLSLIFLKFEALHLCPMGFIRLNYKITKFRSLPQKYKLLVYNTLKPVFIGI